MAQVGKERAELVHHGSRESSTASKSSPWILGAWPDVLLVIASPILVIAALTSARQVWSTAAISSFVMVWAIGHHLPGMMRAYGDPRLFRRFRVRFVLAPLLLLAVCCFTFYFHINSGLLAIASVWGWWHYLMQAYGFSRIYDAKVGSFAVSTRWLDQAMCLCWFAAAVILNDNALYGFLINFYNSGVRIPEAGFFETLRSVVRGITLGVTILFVANLLNRWRQGDRPSLIKPVLMATTFACFWYSAATVTNIVVAYAFFELFHDVQYLTIVWAFNRNRVEKDATLHGFTRWLFQPRVLFVAAYIALIAGYGLLKYGSTKVWVTDQQIQAVLASVFLTSTLLHYYFDGFIWKLRESENRESFDLKSVQPHQMGFSVPPILRHLALWCVFILPLGYLLVAEAMQRIDLQQMKDVEKVQRAVTDNESLAAAAPGSFMAQYALGKTYATLGQDERARDAFQQTLEMNPGFTSANDELRLLDSR